MKETLVRVVDRRHDEHERVGADVDQVHAVGVALADDEVADAVLRRVFVERHVRETFRR
jgi:hypothetical protein